MTQADAVKHRVEALLSCRLTGQGMSRDLALWVADLEPTLHGKLAAVGLIEPRRHQSLQQFIDAFVASRPQVKPGTVVTYRRAGGYLTEFFGEAVDLRKLTPADADRWWAWAQRRAGPERGHGP